MKRILVVESSPSGESSASRRVARELLAELVKKEPGSTVVFRDLAEKPLPHLTAQTVAGSQASDEVIDELLAADVLIIGAPMWNFGPPSVLKAWMDHAARAGRTFKYSAEGIQGLAAGRKAYVVVSSGGVYSQGAAQAADFLTPYLRSFLNFLGITDVSVVRVEGLAIPDLKAGAFEKARAQIAAVAA